MTGGIAPMERARSGRGLAWSVGAALALSLAGLAGLRAVPGSAAPGTRAAAAPALAIPLQDAGGTRRSLAEFSSAKALVVVFLGAECPLSNSYAEPLSQLAAQYRDRGVQFVAV